jgi:hypothetical protein
MYYQTITITISGMDPPWSGMGECSVSSGAELCRSCAPPAHQLAWPLKSLAWLLYLNCNCCSQFTYHHVITKITVSHFVSNIFLLCIMKNSTPPPPMHPLWPGLDFRSHCFSTNQISLLQNFVPLFKINCIEINQSQSKSTNHTGAYLDDTVVTVVNCCQRVATRLFFMFPFGWEHFSDDSYNTFATVTTIWKPGLSVGLQWKYKKCPTSASVVCCDLL